MPGVKFGAGIDLQKSQLNNAAVQGLASAPSAPSLGQIYFNTANGFLYIWDGTTWSLNATNSLKLGNQLPAYYLDRTNHTSTQLASTISDLATVVKAYKLNEFAMPVAPVPFNNQRITGLADPIAPQDAATGGWVATQVQNAASGIDSKPSVRVLTTVNITLSGLQSIDGISLAVGDRVLVTGQTDATQNGVYAVATGAWSRTMDADQTGEITPGAFWFVEEGTTWGRTQWRCNNTGIINIGSTTITIVQFGAASMYTASNGVQLVGQDFRAQVAVGGGILTGGSGLQIDTTTVARTYKTTIGDGAATTFNIDHNLGTRDVTIALYMNGGTYEDVISNLARPTANRVTVGFDVAPSLNSYRVVVVG